MGKDMTFFLFIGMFQGIVDKTKAFWKEEDAEIAFHEYTNYEWADVTLSQQACRELTYGDYSGSVIVELQIEA